MSVNSSDDVAPKAPSPIYTGLRKSRFSLNRRMPNTAVSTDGDGVATTAARRASTDKAPVR
jgi:hypothetical protein